MSLGCSSLQVLVGQMPPSPGCPGQGSTLGRGSIPPRGQVSGSSPVALWELVIHVWWEPPAAQSEEWQNGGKAAEATQGPEGQGGLGQQVRAYSCSRIVMWPCLPLPSLPQPHSSTTLPVVPCASRHLHLLKLRPRGHFQMTSIITVHLLCIGTEQ